MLFLSGDIGELNRVVSDVFFVVTPPGLRALGVFPLFSAGRISSIEVSIDLVGKK